MNLTGKLVQALARRSQVAIVKFAVRGDRERLGMLRPLNGALILNALRWSDEIHSPAEAAPSPTGVDEDELAAALDLIEAQRADTLDDLPGLTDRYAQALADVVDAKLQERDLTREPESLPPTGAVDLMDVLQKSVREARAGRGEPEDPYSRR